MLVDLQSAFVAGDEAVPDAARVLDRSRALLTRARAAGALVVHLQNDGESGTVDEPHTPGWELHLPVETGPRESVIRKTQDDGFEDAPLGALLDDAGVKALALCGVPSEMCVSATARTALACDFPVVLPHDAHAIHDIPAAPGISERVPAALSSRAAEWALSDEIEIVARPGRRGHLHRPPSRPVNRLPSRPVSHLRPGRCAVSPPASWSVNLLPTRPAHCSRPER
ncbi:isochorismatase family protein [Streptomyces nigrescens]|uniref:Isochorismatase family protein n=1 Tax=Streptomyces nigrescens TaxID=1920 RepID=A0ABY7JH94_STRNI|nr:isochorismatase family protein [Streptomyces nigrescens]WAU09522.1 isochorismatase family protein [Streptomyces nigrescens]